MAIFIVTAFDKDLKLFKKEFVIESDYGHIDFDRVFEVGQDLVRKYLLRRTNWVSESASQVTVWKKNAMGTEWVSIEQDKEQAK